MDTSVPAETLKKGVDQPEGPLKSVIQGPIAEMSLLRKSLLFPVLADTAYYDEDVVAKQVEPLGLHLTMEFFDRDGAQAYRLENDHDSVIVCRGTEPDETNDRKADINAAHSQTCCDGHGNMDISVESQGHDQLPVDVLRFSNSDRERL